MKKKPFSIQIQNPCQQDTEAMPRQNGGMYCSNCKKVVHDFSALTDEELIKIFTQKAPGEMCGKLRSDQINRNFIPQQERRYSFYPAKILLLSLFSFKFISPVNAAPHSINYVMQKNDPKPHNSISGRTLDSFGIPLSDITVVIVGQSIQTTSDSSGYFELILPDSIAGDKFTLQLGSPYYQIADTTITKAQLPFTADFEMKKILDVVEINSPDLTISFVGMIVQTPTIDCKPSFWQRLRMRFHRKRRE